MNSLHWPVGNLDLGVGGISYVELLVLYELWAGERLVLEKAHPRCLRPGRPISVSAVPFGPDIDIWRSCRFIAAMMRSLCMLPGGLGRFVPCSIGANHCRLRHFVGRSVVMGLLLVLKRVLLHPFWTNFCCFFTTLPGRLVPCLLVLFHYGIVLLGSLLGPLFWVLPFPGHVVGLITVEDQAAQVGDAEVARRVSGFGGKRFRLNRKTPAHLVGHYVHARPRVSKRLHCFGYPGDSDVDCKRRRCNQHCDDGSSFFPRTGVG